VPYDVTQLTAALSAVYSCCWVFFLWLLSVISLPPKVFIARVLFDWQVWWKQTTLDISVGDAVAAARGGLLLVYTI